MSKPDWNDAPEWAMWLAQDGDGEWYWFEFEPHKHAEKLWATHGGDSSEAGFSGMRNAKWDKTLEPRP